MPRRPCRSLNSRSASPIRVPLDQSGAASAARWIARSGLRDESARVRRVSRVAKTNASAFGPGRCGAGQELQVGTRVGLHRAGDVAEHHEPPAGDPPSPAGEPHRVAAGAQARAQRPPQVDALAAATLLVAARSPLRGCELEARHQAVELRELVRLERVEALAPEQLLVAGEDERRVHLRRVLVRRPARRPYGGRDARTRPPSRPSAGRSRGEATGRAVVGLRLRVLDPAAEDREEDRVESLDLSRDRRRRRPERSSTAAGARPAGRA